MANDGSFIVYSAIPEDPKSQGKSQIYLRGLDQMDAAAIAGTEGGINPFLSPDDRWIGFWNGGKLKKVPVGGGVPAPLCDVVSPFGFDWGPDNTIVFSPQEHVGLSRISGEGGKPEVLTAPDKAKGGIRSPPPPFSSRRQGCAVHGNATLVGPSASNGGPGSRNREMACGD